MACMDGDPRFLKEQHILQVLCNAGGSLSLTALRDVLYETPRSTDSSRRSLLTFLSNTSPHKFQLVEDKRRDDYIVSVKTEAVLCTSYNPKQDSCRDGNACRAFHLCSHFVSNRCKNGSKCKWPHDLHSKHNKTILEQSGLVCLVIKHILLILRQSWVDITVPDICRHYNSRTQCSKGTKCTFLHVCKFFIQGNCRFSTSTKQDCRLSHDIKDSQPMRVWKNFNIDAKSMSSGELLKMLQEKIKKASGSEDSCSSDEDQEEEEEEEDSDQEKAMASPRSLLSRQPHKNLKEQEKIRKASGSEDSCSSVEDQEEEEDSDQEKAVASPRSLLSRQPHRNRRQSWVDIIVPDICLFYNSRTQCSKGTKCTFLHVCKFYIQGNCRFSTKQDCRLSHDIKDSQPMKVWKNFNIDAKSMSSEELLKMLQEKIRKASGSEDSSSSVEDQEEEEDSDQPLNKRKSPELCKYNLSSRCFYGEKCRQVHSEHPFLWQYKVNGQWNSLTKDSLSIEEAFCKVQQQHFMLKIGQIDFQAMTLIKNGDTYKLRRLETSPATASSNDWDVAMATSWQWYFRDKEQIWAAYGQDVKVEEAYQKHLTEQQDSKFEFKAGHFSYILDFSRMEQKNKSVGTVRQVRRRPCTLVTNDILQRNLQIRRVMATILPKNWDDQATDNSQSNFALCHLDIQVQHEEYSRVANLYGQKMDARNIVKIQRIQNKDLWQDFILMQDRMKKQHGGECRVMSLFHGTQDTVVKAICQQNFDFRISGSRVGTKWGKGSYFSTSAKYSHNYTTSDVNGHRFLFLARVLVGDYTLGDQSYGRPPLKHPTNKEGPLYDSCVDNILDPLIFVIFDRRQVYPEYLITYKN